MNKVSIVVLAAAFFSGAAVQAGCNTSLTAVAPDSRYTDNGNGTVTDKITGLMWKQCSEGQSSASLPCDAGVVADYTWQQALQQAETLNNDGGFVGYSDWRLPNHKELSSLVERQCASPAINTNIFPNTPASIYFSSSPGAGVAREAWSVEFGGGGVGDYSFTTAAVRLVRGGL